MLVISLLVAPLFSPTRLVYNLTELKKIEVDESNENELKQHRCGS